MMSNKDIDALIEKINSSVELTVSTRIDLELTLLRLASHGFDVTKTSYRLPSNRNPVQVSIDTNMCLFGGGLALTVTSDRLQFIGYNGARSWTLNSVEFWNYFFSTTHPRFESTQALRPVSDETYKSINEALVNHNLPIGGSLYSQLINYLKRAHQLNLSITKVINLPGTARGLTVFILNEGFGDAKAAICISSGTVYTGALITGVHCGPMFAKLTNDQFWPELIVEYAKRYNVKTILDLHQSSRNDQEFIKAVFALN